MAYHSLGFLGYHFVSHQKFRAGALMADKRLLCDGEKMGLTQLAQVGHPFLSVCIILQMTF